MMVERRWRGGLVAWVEWWLKMSMQCCGKKRRLHIVVRKGGEKSPMNLRCCDHGLWVSCLHPAFSGLRVDYMLGNLESKSMCPPHFDYYQAYVCCRVFYRMVVPGSTYSYGSTGLYVSCSGFVRVKT
jgi:hypothetical protein